ncbi:hypothetical protein CDAR_55491 [Caerostris darwini]|uniref:Uncharacterized protein n=1 Tax=Caerostris darwini TaxID=1538125 RepID=A0AAV4WVN0_9ARAC|nr:hypothetical protein CDAR_55491 [Caerostris darwini]
MVMNETSRQVTANASLQYRCLLTVIALVVILSVIGTYELIRYFWKKWEYTIPVLREIGQFEMYPYPLEESHEGSERNAQRNCKGKS